MAKRTLRMKVPCAVQDKITMDCQPKAHNGRRNYLHQTCSQSNVQVVTKQFMVQQTHNCQDLVKSSAPSTSKGKERHIQSLVKQNNPVSDSDSSCDEFFNDHKLFPQNRIPYNEKEDEEILKYVLQNHHLDRVMSLSLWRELEMVKGEPRRSYQSLKNRFLRNIKPVMLTKFHYMLSELDVKKIRKRFPQLSSKRHADTKFPQIPMRTCKHHGDMSVISSSSGSEQCDRPLIIDEGRLRNKIEMKRQQRNQPIPGKQMRHVAILTKPTAKSVHTMTESPVMNMELNEDAGASWKPRTFQLLPEQMKAEPGKDLKFFGSVDFMSRKVNVIVTAKLVEEDTSFAGGMAAQVNVTCTLTPVHEGGTDENIIQMVKTAVKPERRPVAMKKRFKKLNCLKKSEKARLMSLVEKLIKVDRQRAADSDAAEYSTRRVRR